MTINPARIMGHRGVPSLAPENTLGGFTKAAEVGTRWVELDVTLLQDLTPIVHHDATLDRCTDAQGELANVKRSDLEGVNFAAQYPDWPFEPAPFLVDVLDRLQRLDMGLNLEIKRHSHASELIAQVVVDTVKRGFPADQLLISSFDVDVLRSCQALAPDIPLGLICDELPADWLSLAKELNLFSLHCDWTRLNYQQAVEVKQQGYKLYCWTVNDPRDVTSFWHWGVDGVMSNNPQDFHAGVDTES